MLRCVHRAVVVLPLLRLLPLVQLLLVLSAIVMGGAVSSLLSDSRRSSFIAGCPRRVRRLLHDDVSLTAGVRVPGIGASVRPSVHLSRREARMKLSLSMSLATSAEERHRVVDLSFLDLIGRKRQLSSYQDARLHVILLNRPLPDYVPALMRLSTIVVCADGGANRLYDQFTREHEARINGKQKSDNGHDDSTPLERIDEAAIPQPARSMSVPAIKHKRDGSRCEHAGRLSLIRRATRRPSMMSLAAFVGPDEPLLLPSHICGDLDSVRPDVLEYFKDREVSILHDRDQDTNDLEKCFQFVRSEFQTGDKVVVVGAFGGRFDQVG
uniref:Thiamin pyrophosphokinase catalytic domain-containing protein n=1 Tax=Vitrella brassicaformis TaxID=1169539 RepID=A0A7S1JNC4_9ALVE|mmetsp:Transcript_15565/g.37091  ORF Transcript_15565/g.37091 Transcript_15565/m.37091 type:complete len:325 (+) Transcript_15565:45-1019(+)